MLKVTCGGRAEHQLKYRGTILVNRYISRSLVKMRMSDGQLRSMLLTEMLLDSCMLSVALVAQNAGGQCGIVPDSSGP